ncbi:hypothetical protein ACFFU8_09540 [Chromobacterium piscinae]|uniref:hypothetical protein n=1 Tax=Chromobacterium piscinae TaxID=686831 RepID=UPI001E60C1CF|nr:hypothetical protein [Chromobacterium piscinae]MCD5327853.1 hypothetical protein [Chromobacterium piscinae]
MNHHNEASAEILKQALTMAFSLGAHARETDTGCLPVGADVVTLKRYTDEALAALTAQRVAAGTTVDQQQTGVYGKFTVCRVDGRDAPGGDRYGADYFVLDVTHDRFAKPALAAYAQACSGGYALLGQDLVMRYDLGDFSEMTQPEATLCELPPCGVPDTPPAVREWVELASAIVRQQLTGAITASLWAYRLGSTEYLSCDLTDEAGAAWPLTIVAAGTPKVSGPVDEPHTTDLAEALHLAALLVKALGATATFGRE